MHCLGVACVRRLEDKLLLAVLLLQPAPECIQLFDDVLLLTEGRVIYQ